MQTEAEALILEVVGRRLGTPVAPARVDLPGGSHIHVDGMSQERPVFGNEDTGTKLFEVITEPRPTEGFG